MNGWIPVWAGLPDTQGEVLVTRVQGKNRYVETAGWFANDSGVGRWVSVWDEYCIGPNRSEVVAWMPLPNPWEGGKDKND